MPVTELGSHTLKPGVDIMDETNPGGKIIFDAWKAVVDQPTGPWRVYWGVEEENPRTAWGFFDFASVEEHQKFAQEHGADIVKDFEQVFVRDSASFTKHVCTQPYPPSALRAPVTEIMLAYFPSDLAPEGRTAANLRMAAFADKALAQCEDVVAVNFGWGLETDFPVRGGHETGCVLVAFIGWPSIDAHMRFRETQVFKDNVGLLRDMEGMIKLAMFHIKCRVMENKVRKD